jgi:signal recognition particle receptor subunit beta
MSTTTLIATNDHSTLGSGQKDTKTALRFITCGSVDDGKSTLIGRLLVDSKAVLQDHLAGVQRQGETDLALLTDGLSAEREQGITIDVAYRYFNTEDRKFIIGDAPGHEQYTRNMVTAASSADAAVVLVDATKLDWQNLALELLVQTRRHSLLCKLLRVPSIVFAVNKLDAVADAPLAFAHISRALEAFATAAGIPVTAIVPVSALKGWNVVDAAVQPGWCGYTGPTLLALLETLPATPAESDLPLAFPVQWVEKPGAPTSPLPLPPAGADAPWGGPAGHRSIHGPARVLGPRGHWHGGNRARRCRCSRADRPQRWPRCWTTHAAPETSRPATAPASSWTARWTSRAATGSMRPPRWRCVRRRPPRGPRLAGAARHCPARRPLCPVRMTISTPPHPCHVLAREPRAQRHHRLDGRRALDRRARVLGAARAPLGEGQGPAHRAPPGRQHASGA